MSKLMTSLGGNTGAILAGGGMIAALGLGAYLGFGAREQAVEPAVLASPEGIAPKTEKTDMAAVENKTPEIPTAAAPRFDELRREPDGTVIIAGRAEPLSDVQILVDGEEIGTAKADSTGGFAAITNVPATGRAQVVSLSSQSGEDVTASEEEIILAPQAVATAPPPAEIASEEQIAPAPQAAQIASQSAGEAVQKQAGLAEEGANAEQPPVADAAEADAGDQQSTSETIQAAVADQAPVAVLRSDAAGVSLLNAGVSTQVALDTIGYSEMGEVQLTGRAQPDTARVRVYLDNRSVISLPVGADGRWRGDLPDVDEGVYTLRVDELTAAGAVSSRVETPFKRESVETLTEAAAQTDGPIKSITVQAGATLWAIARERYGDGTLYLRVFEANGDSIRDPDLIYPGQVFDLPN